MTMIDYQIPIPQQYIIILQEALMSCAMQNPPHLFWNLQTIITTRLYCKSTYTSEISVVLNCIIGFY